MYVLAAFTKLFSATKSVSMSKYNIAVLLFCFVLNSYSCGKWKPLYHICIIFKKFFFFFFFFFCLFVCLFLVAGVLEIKINLVTTS